MLELGSRQPDNDTFPLYGIAGTIIIVFTLFTSTLYTYSKAGNWNFVCIRLSVYENLLNSNFPSIIHTHTHTYRTEFLRVKFTDAIVCRRRKKKPDDGKRFEGMYVLPFKVFAYTRLE